MTRVRYPWRWHVLEPVEHHPLCVDHDGDCICAEIEEAGDE